MELPKALAAALAAADQAYLTGLSNKGTVNRALKDLETLPPPEIRIEDDGVCVRMGQAECLIRAPLGESRCSCPSSAMCRHRIAAIVYLQRQLHSSGTEAPAQPVFQELRDYPTEKLARQLGAKRLSAALFRWRSGSGPVLEEHSVITVEMPWLPATVRLLEPLEHSSCSCHSKQLCVHKAEALLYWQLAHGIADAQALPSLEAEKARLDPQTVRGICLGVCQTLSAQLTTGLCRLPPEACETVERMASLCHTAGLPELERCLRGLHQTYTAYFARSAAFRDTRLLSQLSRTFRLAQALEHAPEDAALAGTFRDAYEPVGQLHLYLLGLRDVSGQSGYGGTIYYFWDREHRRFYTFSDLRPTFYEGHARAKPDAAPWGLPCSLRQVWNCAVDLTGAKATRSGRLSATGGCTAVLAGRCAPDGVFPREEICTDFQALLTRRSAPRQPEIARLAVVRPRQCRIQAYDEVRQVFSLQLLDAAKRDLWLEVPYRKEEARVVDQMDRLALRLRQYPELRPVFFGVVYREEDRLKLYPIEYFTDWEGCP